MGSANFKPLEKVKLIFLYLIVRGAAIILRILPFSLAVSIGELLGRVDHLVDRRHREVAFKNLALIFNGKERKKLIPS